MEHKLAKVNFPTPKTKLEGKINWEREREPKQKSQTLDQVIEQTLLCPLYSDLVWTSSRSQREAIDMVEEMRNYEKTLTSIHPCPTHLLLVGNATTDKGS